MKCNNCGFDNIENSSFCQECGSKLSVPEVVSPEVIESEPLQPETVTPEAVQPETITPISEETPIEENTPDITNQDVMTPAQPIPTQPIPTQPMPQQSELPMETKKKKSKLPLIIIIVVLAVVLIGAAATFGKEMFFKSDEEKLIEATKKTQIAKQKAIVGEIGFEEFSIDGIGVMEAAVVENLVKGLKVEYKVLSDATDYKVEANLGIVLNGSELIDIILHMNKDYIAIGVPALYDEIIYLNWDDVQDVLLKYDLITEDEMPDIDAERVIELIDAYAKALDFKSYDAYKNFDEKMYEDLTYGYLTQSMVDVSKGNLDFEVAGEELSFDGQVYTFDIEMDKYMSLSTTLMETLLKDENILPMIIEGATRVIDTVIVEEDVNVYNMIQSMEYNEMADKWDSKFEDELIDMRDEFIDNIEDQYKDAIDEIDTALEEDEYSQVMDAMKDIYSEIGFDMKLVVDDGYVKGTESIITIDDSIIDAINDSEALNEMAGYELNSLTSLDLLFKVSMYQRTGMLQIDEPISFDGLPSGAIDFAKLDEMELFEIYQEIMINAETLSSGLMGSF